MIVLNNITFYLNIFTHHLKVLHKSVVLDYDLHIFEQSFFNY